MKKFLALVLALVMVLSFAACGTTEPAEPTDEPTTEPTEEPTEDGDIAVAMITDYGDINDESFNQTTYEACRDYCGQNLVNFMYYKPAGDTTADRVAMIEKAIDEGYSIIVMPGYSFAEAIAEVAPENEDVKFIALDCGEADFAGVGVDDISKLPNVYSMVYQEELCGYMAGYAAVKLGYKKLGFLGGMAVPAVIRYGYGFIQGADNAALELGLNDVEVNYAYGNQFFGDGDITSAMDTWYGNGTEVVFACGGGIYTSAAEAAAKVGGKVIGVDVDQSSQINVYGDGMTVTSAMKGLYPSTIDALKKVIEDDRWVELAGRIVTLGLVSDSNPEDNFVQIPMETTQWNDTFTQDDYKALVAKMYNGEITVSNNVTITAAENANSVTVNDFGNIK